MNAKAKAWSVMALLAVVTLAVVILSQQPTRAAGPWYVAQAASITVTTTADDLTNNGNCSLREAIQAANTDSVVDACPAGSGADVITLPAGTYTLTRVGAGEDGNATGDLDITDSLTLVGADKATTIINANNLDRALHAPTAGVTLTLFNLTVRNGNVGSDGGGLYAAGPVVVSNTTFLSNRGGNGGGAYFLSTAMVTGTAFLSNTANGEAGGARFNDSATVAGTTFLGNTSGAGGGAYFFSVTTVTGTAFLSNTALIGGGGGAAFQSLATVIGTTFTGNMATGDGGGAWFYATATVTGTTFYSNTTSAYGGGVCFIGADMARGDFVNTLFAANRDNPNQGAGLYVLNLDANAIVNLRHVTIASSATVESGSAVYVGAGTVNITNTIVASYSVGLERAGGVLNENYNLFSGVTQAYSGMIVSGGNSIIGPAAFVNTTSYTLSGASTAINNGANAGVTSDFEGDARPLGAGFDIGYDEYSGADAAISGLAANNDSPKTTTTDVSFTATFSAGTGIRYFWNFGDGQTGVGDNLRHAYMMAGLYTATVTGTNSLGSASASTWVTITPLMPITVTTTNDELNQDGDCSLREAVQAANTNIAVDVCSAGGGRDTIVLPAGTYILTLAGAGEDANTTGDLDITSPLTLDGADMATTIINANNLDRALHVPTTGVTLTLLNLTVRNGNATNDNGGGLLAAGPVVMSNTAFVRNAAYSGGGAYFYGRATVTVADTIFYSNTVSSGYSGGGGAYFYDAGTVMVTGTTFQDNTAPIGDGGGAYFHGTAMATVTVTGTTFHGNTASSGGGADFSGAATVTVTGTTFSDNTAISLYGGGGAYFEGPTMVTVTGSTFRGNTASFGGGFHSGGTLTLNNSTVSGNTGSNIGGIYNSSGGTLTLNNSTVSGNTGGSNIGGIYNDITNGTVTLQNSILAGNVATSGTSRDCGGTIGSSGYNLIGNTAGCTFNTTTGDLLNVNPKLWPALVGTPGTRPLLPGSPAIDAGNPNGCQDQQGNLLTTDQRGIPRIGRCDIGAFEFDPNNNPIKQTFLASIHRPRPIPRRIFGYVTENGASAAGVALLLRFYDGANWSTLASTTTAANGSYEFLNEPNLAAGQEYYVRYQNTGGAGAMPNRLWVWGTRELTAYSGEEVNVGDFDIANITLTAPNDSEAVELPYTFQWTPRPATPTDTYEFDLYDPYDLDPYAYVVVGYTGAFTLNSLPPDFNVGDWYWWEIWVYSPDGGYGVSYESRWVNFTNTGNVPTHKPVHPLLPKPLRFLDEMLKH